MDHQTPFGPLRHGYVHDCARLDLDAVPLEESIRTDAGDMASWYTEVYQRAALTMQLPDMRLNTSLMFRVRFHTNTDEVLLILDADLPTQPMQLSYLGVPDYLAKRLARLSTVLELPVDETSCVILSSHTVKGAPITCLTVYWVCPDCHSLPFPVPVTKVIDLVARHLSETPEVARRFPPGNGEMAGQVLYDTDV